MYELGEGSGEDVVDEIIGMSVSESMPIRAILP